MIKAVGDNKFITGINKSGTESANSTQFWTKIIL